MKLRKFNTIITICLSLFAQTVYGHTMQLFDENSPITEPTIIVDNNSNTGDDREYTFPFAIEYDEKSNSLIINYDQERPADLDLTNEIGTIISHQSISGSGSYRMSLPSGNRTIYLFMTTPTLIAYVTITL